MIELYLGPEKLAFKFDMLNYNDIAILFSGGVDSTLLLYLLLLENQKYKKKITTYVIDRYNQPINVANHIYSILSNKFNITDNLNILELPKVQPNEEVMIGSNLLSNKHSIVMTGVNKYPSDKTIRPNYEPKFLRDHIKDNDRFKFPFKHLEKYHIIDAFYKLEIENILPYTRSCGLNNSIPCANCFNCRERIWAYNILNLNYDLGS